MSYTTIAQCAADPALFERINSCVAQEQIAKGDQAQPGLLNSSMAWAVAGAGDVEAAYESALAAGNLNPGGDPAVITDGMILAHVQANWPPPGLA